MKKIISTVMMLSVILFSASCSNSVSMTDEVSQDTIVTTADNTPAIDLITDNEAEQTSIEQSTTAVSSSITDESITEMTASVIATDNEKSTTPISEPECEGRHYSEIIELFKEAGFTNIVEAPYQLDYGYDPETRYEGCVISVTVNGDGFFDKDDIFDSNSEVMIGYALLPPETQPPETTTSEFTTTTTASVNEVTNEYVLNTNTMKFHYPSCSSAKKIKDSNRSNYTGTRDELINMGYSPCGNCHPYGDQRFCGEIDKGLRRPKILCCNIPLG